MEIYNEEFYDVVIVGGGISGITTAYMLRDKKILLLEKEKRMGGRVWSEDKYTATNNIGTQFFTDADTSFNNLINELGIEFVTHKPKKVPYAFYLNKKFYQDMKELMTPRVKMDVLKLMARALPRIISFSNPDSRNWNDLVKQNMIGELRGISENTKSLIQTYMRGTCLAKPENTSKGMGSALMLGPFALGKVAFVKGGFESITQAMLKKMEDKIKDNSQVTRIEDKDNIVHIHYEKDGETHIIKSKKCVVATEAPYVTKLIPDLPDWKKEALNGVKYGPITMVSVFFRKKVPWERFFALMSDDTLFQIMVDQTYDTEDDRNDVPVMCNFIITEYPDETQKIDDFLALSDEEIVNKTLDDFNRILPMKFDVRENLIESKVTRFPLGEIELSPEYYSQHLPKLSKSVGNIHFAGDYTHFISFVEGAVYSAFEVSRALGSKYVVSKEDEYYVKVFPNLKNTMNRRK